MKEHTKGALNANNNVCNVVSLKMLRDIANSAGN